MKDQSTTNMILLRNWGKYAEFATLSFPLYELNELSDYSSAKIGDQKVYGNYSKGNYGIATLFRHEGELYFSINEQFIQLVDAFGATHTLNAESSVLTIHANCRTIIEIPYVSKATSMVYEFDPTPFVEPEDFDFFLFVFNVLNDTGRRSRIYTGC